MNLRILAGLASAAILATFAASALGAESTLPVHTEKIGIYPIYERDVTALDDGESSEVIVDLHSALGGLIAVERRPEWFFVRIGPAVYQKRVNEHYFQPILLSGTDYLYDSDQGVRQVLVPLETDVAYTSILAWRGEHPGEPYMSGGVVGLFGLMVWDFGFKSFEGDRYRAWALTELLQYADNEAKGRTVMSLGGLVGQVAWDVPDRPKTWEAGLLTNAFAVGRNEGKVYGRFLWLPVGRAPSPWKHLPIAAPVRHYAGRSGADK